MFSALKDAWHDTVHLVASAVVNGKEKTAALTGIVSTEVQPRRQLLDDFARMGVEADLLIVELKKYAATGLLHGKVDPKIIAEVSRDAVEVDAARNEFTFQMANPNASLSQVEQSYMELQKRFSSFYRHGRSLVVQLQHGAAE